MKKKSSKKPLKKRPGRLSTLRLRLRVPFLGREWVEYLDARRISELMGVSRQTAYKWISGTHPIDPHKLKLLTLLATGILPFEGWENWRFDGGRLFAWNKYSFAPDELVNFSYIKQLNDEYRRQIAAQNAEISTLKAQLKEALSGRPATAQIISLPDYQQRPPMKRPG